MSISFACTNVWNHNIGSKSYSSKSQNCPALRAHALQHKPSGPITSMQSLSFRILPLPYLGRTPLQTVQKHVQLVETTNFKIANGAFDSSMTYYIWPITMTSKGSITKLPQDTNENSPSHGKTMLVLHTSVLPSLALPQRTRYYPSRRIPLPTLVTLPNSSLDPMYPPFLSNKRNRMDLTCNCKTNLLRRPQMRKRYEAFRAYGVHIRVQLCDEQTKYPKPANS